jgi:moderate conductance mechanosensitive channel
MEFKDYLDKFVDWCINSGLSILIVIVLSFLAIKAAKSIINGLFSAIKEEDRGAEAKKRADTLSSLILHLVIVVIVAVAVIMILEKLGLEIGPILAAAGVVGLAVGFGAQHLVQDIISGFFILVDNQVRVGDVVQIAGTGGLVEKVNLRMIMLRDLAGNVHYIRNGQIGTVTNMTKDYSQYVFDIGVAYRENYDDVVRLIKEVDVEMRNDAEFKADILEPIEILGLDQFADSAIIIKARTKTKPIRQWTIGREFNRRLKMKFDENNVEIPFPHMTLYAGQDKDGNAPAWNVTSGGGLNK